MQAALTRELITKAWTRFSLETGAAKGRLESSKEDWGPRRLQGDIRAEKIRAFTPWSS